MLIDARLPCYRLNKLLYLYQMIALVPSLVWPKRLFQLLSWLPLVTFVVIGLFLLLVAHTTYPGYAYRPPSNYAGYSLLKAFYSLALYSSPFLTLMWLAGVMSLRPELTFRMYAGHILLFLSGVAMLTTLNFIESGTWYWLLG